MTKRFEYREFSQSIYDNLTGKIYDGNQKTCDLLNAENDRADRNAELNTDENLLNLRWQRDIYKHFSDEVLKLMSKYEISTLAKLDQMLFNQKKW